MPLYEYQCKKCGHRFERIQTYSAEDAKECPLCQGEVERLISTPARAHFKGSGFYSTDYAAAPSGKSQDGGQGAPSDGGSKSADKGGTDKAGSDKSGTDKGSAAKTESTSTPAASSGSSKSEA
jgi:putative FmdB family regulatory protein